MFILKITLQHCKLNTLTRPSQADTGVACGTRIVTAKAGEKINKHRLIHITVSMNSVNC